MISSPREVREECLERPCVQRLYEYGQPSFGELEILTRLKSNRWCGLFEVYRRDDSLVMYWTGQACYIQRYQYHSPWYILTSFTPTHTMILPDTLQTSRNGFCSALPEILSTDLPKLGEFNYKTAHNPVTPSHQIILSTLI